MIRLLVDSAADFSQEEIKEQAIEMVPLKVLMHEREYLDGIDLFHDDFYEELVHSQAFFKTSQPSPQAFLKVFEQVKQQGDTLICILISSGLSGTFQSARLAKSMVEYENIYLIDSLSATAGIRILVEKAQTMIQEGKQAQDIVSCLEELKQHIQILAVVDTLEYLSRGGRVSKTVATIGEMANIKPLITVDSQGKVEVIGKRPGIIRATSQLIKTLETVEVDLEYPMYSLYTYGCKNCEKMELKLEKNGVNCQKRLQIGPTIGTHVGPEAFGICFVQK